MTIRRALICDKWEFPIIDGQSGFFKHTNISELSRRAICFEWLIDGVPKDKTVTEYFGGIGLQSVIIQNSMKPSRHSIFDIDPDCISQIASLYQDTEAVKVELQDAKEIMGTSDDDVIILDFPNMTAKHYSEWAEPLAAVFSKHPKLVEITDVGNRYLHLHRNLYSVLLGNNVDTIPDYIEAISRYLYSLYGYSVIKAAYKSGTSYMFLGETEPQTPDMLHVTSNPSGFRYIE